MYFILKLDLSSMVFVEVFKSSFARIIHQLFANCLTSNIGYGACDQNAETYHTNRARGYSTNCGNYATGDLCNLTNTFCYICIRLNTFYFVLGIFKGGQGMRSDSLFENLPFLVNFSSFSLKG